MFLYQCMFVYNLFIFFSSCVFNYSPDILSHPVDVSHETACMFTEAESEACVCIWQDIKLHSKECFTQDWET